MNIKPARGKLLVKAYNQLTNLSATNRRKSFSVKEVVCAGDNEKDSYPQDYKTGDVIMVNDDNYSDDLYLKDETTQEEYQIIPYHFVQGKLL